jgi:hypothetical protein
MTPRIVERTIVLPTELVVRGSCGCASKSEVTAEIYKTSPKPKSGVS